MRDSPRRCSRPARRSTTLLAPQSGALSRRPAVQAAFHGDRDGAVVALARETDALQQADRRRLERSSSAAESYLRAFAGVSTEDRRLPEGHARICALAERWLPTRVSLPEAGDAPVE